jgi:16S rRNA (uracil1498-N3)-methyltransferase
MKKAAIAREMPGYDFRTQRLFVEADLSAGDSIEASRGQANYLLAVLRKKSGYAVLLFNGRDGEWLAHIGTADRRRCTLDIDRQTRPQPSPGGVIYCFAPLKHARLDYMVQKAVEMGAAVLQPVRTEHVQTTRLNEDRMRANAIEAAEQCGILSIPEIRPAVGLDVLLDGWNRDVALVHCDEAGAATDHGSALAPLRGRPLGLLVGPEGGFTESERARLRALPFVVPISLGPRILRADTAAVAALAIVQLFAGDWGEPPASTDIEG